MIMQAYLASIASQARFFAALRMTVFVALRPGCVARGDFVQSYTAKSRTTGGMSNAAMCRWFGCPGQRRNAE